MGVVLAAAALLVDFARKLSRLALQPPPSVPHLKHNLRNVDASIATLQSAIDASKEALSETERMLDTALAKASTAETAISSMEDTRAAISAARSQTNEAQEQLTIVRNALRASSRKQADTAESTAAAVRECARLERKIVTREAELLEVSERLKKARAVDTDEANSMRENEQMLVEELSRREAELSLALSERDEVQRRSADLKKKASALEVEATAAAEALIETEKELELVRKEVECREQEWKNMELEDERAITQSEETEKLKIAVENMERELMSLQDELRVRDETVRNVSSESDKLRSALATREAELRELQQRLESADSADNDHGGDPRRSAVNLEEVKLSLEAERLTLLADIARAEVARDDAGEEIVDPLQRVKKEMSAQNNELRANMISAEALLRKANEEHMIRDSAVQEIMTLSEFEDEVERTQSINCMEGERDISWEVQSEEIQGSDNDSIAENEGLFYRNNEKEFEGQEEHGADPLWSKTGSVINGAKSSSSKNLGDESGNSLDNESGSHFKKLEDKLMDAAVAENGTAADTDVETSKSMGKRSKRGGKDVTVPATQSISTSSAKQERAAIASKKEPVIPNVEPVEFDLSRDDVAVSASGGDRTGTIDAQRLKPKKKRGRPRKNS